MMQCRILIGPFSILKAALFFSKIKVSRKRVNSVEEMNILRKGYKWADILTRKVCRNSGRLEVKNKSIMTFPLLRQIFYDIF